VESTTSELPSPKYEKSTFVNDTEAEPESLSHVSVSLKDQELSGTYELVGTPGWHNAASGSAKRARVNV
jgi:hypothetical protein